VSDKIAAFRGLDGRTQLLFGCMVLEGVGLILFSKAPSVTTAILSMTFFGLFTHMACGATYAVVPFIDRKALGGVTGIIGAGGNVGAVAAGFVNKAAGNPQDTFFILGVAVLVISLCALAVRFSSAHKASEQELLDEALAQRARQTPSSALVPAVG
jgi:NNP family nitrate/nitrite transporter-like MFS transporter